MDTASPASFRVTCSTTDGVLTVVRDVHRIVFRVAYRDPVQSCPAPQPSREAVTRAIDRLRDQAVAAMRRIVAELLQQLLPLLPAGGRPPDAPDPAVRPSALLSRAIIANGTLSVFLPPVYVTVTDPAAPASSDRFLVEEFGRAAIRQRVQELWLAYEDARRDLLEDLEGGGR